METVESKLTSKPQIAPQQAQQAAALANAAKNVHEANRMNPFKEAPVVGKQSSTSKPIPPVPDAGMYSAHTPLSLSYLVA